MSAASANRGILWLGVLLCVGWTAAIIARAAPGGLLDIAVAVAPAVIGALAFTAFALCQSVAAEIPDDRLVLAEAGAAGLEDRLRTLDAVLADCVARTIQLAEAASSSGRGLGATATGVALAAADLTRASEEAGLAVASLRVDIPDLARQVGGLETSVARVAGETANQLVAIDTLLASVTVRGREAAQQADATVATIAAQLGVIDDQSKETTSVLAKRAYALDAAIDGVLQRAVATLETVGERVAEQTAALESGVERARVSIDAVGIDAGQVIGVRIAQLTDAAERLRVLHAAQDEHSARLIERTEAHLDSLPARLESARHDGDAVLGGLATRIGIVQRNLADLATPFAASGGAITALAEQLDVLRRVADDVGIGLAGQLPATVAELRNVDAGAVALVQRVEGLRETLQASGEAVRVIREAVGTTRIEVAALGEADARGVLERLTEVDDATRQLGLQIAAHADAGSQAGERLAASMTTLEERFAVVCDDGDTRLAALTEQVAALAAAATELATPLARARAVAGDFEAQVAGADAGVAAFGDQLDDRLGRAGDALARLDAAALQLLAGVDGLHAGIDATSGSIEAASAALSGERTALVAATDGLAASFDAANDGLQRLRAATSDAASETSAQLVPVFDHVRQLSEAGAEALRKRLADVADDVEQILRTGSERAADAFAMPLQRQLAAIDDAATRTRDTAEVAAQRVAEQVGALGVAIDAVDARVAETEVRIDVRARDTLAVLSGRLIEQLGAGSIDIAQLLAADVGENAWVEYLGGDRSVFARRTVRAVDSATSRKIARHYRHDEAFRDAASRYIDTFETLTRRVVDDPDGAALMATIVSSDLGKLYVMIARATGRLAA